ncbi:hypothetical protein BC332_09479 [Capsicum chinense]|nr:hypothetical protein BC332_09479 [Capsicum chinense]
MEFTKESESLLDKIRPPRLEDAGLEDCALPPESIKEAFLKAATAVRSIISASDDEDESQGQCVKAPSPNDDFTKDALIGITEGITDIPGKCTTEKGGGGEVPEGIIDVVDVQGGSKDSDDRGDLVDGLSLPEGGESCVDGLQGLEIGEKGGKIKKKEGKEEDEEASDEKPTLVEGMITGAAGATVYYSLKLRHPLLDLPIIDYDLALLFQPMLLLGISIGVVLNVLFAEWMVTILLIILFLVASIKAFFKGFETWKKETIIKEEAVRRLTSNDAGGEEVAYKLIPGGPKNDSTFTNEVYKAKEVSIFDNMYWKDTAILIAVWIIILFLHVSKNYAPTCSTTYWILNLLQLPIAVGASAYEAVCLYKGSRVILSSGEAVTTWKVHQLILYCFCGILAGIVGGLLGLGGGFILGPLFLELGIPPQVSSATAAFVMIFSSSMSVIQYYLLGRFPVPYALYFIAVAIVAALVGQHVVRRIISIVGGFGIADTIKKIEEGHHMGFDNICAYNV